MRNLVDRIVMRIRYGIKSEPEIPLNSIVIFDDPDGFYKDGPLKNGHMYLFLGEIHNMAGHCIVSEYPRGIVHAGIHTDNFVTFDEEKWHFEKSKWVRNKPGES